SFFIIKLLKRSQSFQLAPEFQPEGFLPPVSWKGSRGHQGIEKIFPAIGMTLYSK
ncbi:hypothetical protein C8R42DRAFT_532930, partial [Lentinula raphanica]